MRFHKPTWIWTFAAVAVLAMFGSLPTFAASPIAYRVQIEGVRDKELRELLQAVSHLVADEERPPGSLNMLRKRAANDLPNLRKALRAMGYYDSRITFKIEPQMRPVRVIVQVEPGDPFLLASVKLRIRGHDPSLRSRLPSWDTLGLSLHAPLKSRTVLDAEKELVKAARHHGHPFARMADRKVVVDFKTRTATVTLVLDPGPRASFGQTTFTGLKSVKESFLRRRLPWHPGQPFDANLLDEVRKKLVATNLFALIQVSTGKHLDAQKRLPIEIQLTERKHRTIKAGLLYTTDEGFGARVSWEHRNIFHGGQKLRLEASGSPLAREFDAYYQEPDFFSEKQSLLTNFRFADETTDAYDSLNISTEARVKRQLYQKLMVSLGLGFRISRVDEDGKRSKFALLYVPGDLSWDFTDDPFDPSSGGRLRVEAIPYYNANGSALGFFKGYLSYSHYLKVFDHPRIIFANRAALGVISGVDRDDVPADLRFYAGGGGSIRGYSYQSVGPLDSNDDPLGGNSVFELNSEVRAMITKSIGMVAFIDGGSAFTDSYPSFDNTLRWGAGAGFRYFTPVGPLRIDVAVPLNRRQDVDDHFQIYISLGQAF